jgi:hypothetical protein
MFCFYLQLLPEKFLILRRNDIWSKTYIRLRVKCLLLSHFNETWIFPAHFRQVPKYQALWKSVQWETDELFHKNRKRTDMTKLAVAFRNLRTRLNSGCKLEAPTSPIWRKVTKGFCAVGEVSSPDFCKSEVPVPPRRIYAELQDLSDSHSLTLLTWSKQLKMSGSKYSIRSFILMVTTFVFNP